MGVPGGAIGMVEAVSWSGTVFDARDVPEVEADPDPCPDLVSAVWRVRQGVGDPAEVIVLLRGAVELWVETETSPVGYQVRSLHTQGLSWMPVCTSLVRFALWGQSSGRGQERIQYGTISGGELWDQVLPGLPVGTGVVLDPASEHMLALPPLSGLAPEVVALDREETVR